MKKVWEVMICRGCDESDESDSMLRKEFDKFAEEGCGIDRKRSFMRRRRDESHYNSNADVEEDWGDGFRC